MTTPRELKRLLEQGVNISAHLRHELGTEANTERIIELAYDLQTGRYIDLLADPEMARRREDYGREIAATVRSLCEPASILEAGVGEATTMAHVIGHLGSSLSSYAFDLSWSRVAYARGWLTKNGCTNTSLCTGSLLRMPFADDSVDVVYTSHAIEPNRGAEEAILRELNRVARRFVLLLEPAYELASPEIRARMELHGYCRDLPQAARALGHDVVRHELFLSQLDPVNPTALTVIRKDTATRRPPHVLACPMFRTPLREIAGALFSPEALVVYPIVGGIPCLRVENGVLASKYEELMNAR